MQVSFCLQKGADTRRCRCEDPRQYICAHLRESADDNAYTTDQLVTRSIGGCPVNIRPAISGDHDALIDIWLSAVRATHHFLSESDIQSLLTLVRQGALNGLEIWVLCAEGPQPIGFMGLADSRVEALFLAPEYHGCGGGRRLLQHARQLKGLLTVDVNEQNPAAVRFYEACGFVVEARSELDSCGLPFPILHMRQLA
jgi:putative acetyltransferase